MTQPMAAAGAALIDTRSVRDRSGPSSARWANLVEFLVVGGATLLLLPLAWLLRGALGLDDAELVVGFLAFHAASLINDPHFAVTYLLFYRDAKRRAFGNVWQPWQRVRYLFAAAVVPLVLAGWAAHAISSDSQRSLGLMIQLMFLLVGWHYVKQGFGVLVVLSARRGVTWSPRERQIVLGHCFSGWAYAWASPADFGTPSVEKGVFYTTLGQPVWLEPLTLAAFAISGVVLLGALLSKWRRDGSLPWAPVVGLLVTIWLWSVFSSIDPLLVYVIPALHSLQYLYFVWLLERNRGRAHAGADSFQTTVRNRLLVVALSSVALGWVLLRGLPCFLDHTFVLHDASDPAGLAGVGSTPYLAAFFTFVNVHHYFMDTVIWRRDNPDTRLLRD